MGESVDSIFKEQCFALVTGQGHHSSGENLRSQLAATLKSASKFPTKFPALPPEINHLPVNLNDHAGREELSSLLDIKNYQAAVFLVGNTDGDPEQYTRAVHDALNAWNGSVTKPAVLFASEKPDMTRKAIDSWAGLPELAKQLKATPDDVKKAFTINTKHLTPSPGLAWEHIQKLTLPPEEGQKTWNEIKKGALSFGKGATAHMHIITPRTIVVDSRVSPNSKVIEVASHEFVGKS